LNSSSIGLSSKEAWRRAKKYGPNTLPVKRKHTRLRIFLSQWKSLLILILLIATALSFVVGDNTDGIVIFVTILINVFIGYFQENKAQNALFSLSHLLAEQSVVIRDGHEKILPISDIVPGDIFVINAGMKIPADARLIESTELQTNEASLTGESLPVDKRVSPITRDDVPLAEQHNMVFSGTVVVAGMGKAIVCTTGLSTEIGRIAHLLTETRDDETPLQKQLAFFSRRLGEVIIFLIFFFVFIGLLSGKSFVDLFLISIALAVAAIPEGLLLAVTVTLAIGMQNILKRKGLLRQLSSAETLGSTSVICCDKTGTLTEGNMEVTDVYTVDKKFHLRESRRIEDNDGVFALKIGLLENDVVVENQKAPRSEWKLSGTPTGKALFSAGISTSLSRDTLLLQEKLLNVFPFTSERKMRASLHVLGNKKNIIYIAGAFEHILSACDFYLSDGSARKFSSQMKQETQEKMEKLAGRGLRIIAVAFREVSPKIRTLASKQHQEPWLKQLTFVGLLALRDVVRPDVPEVLKSAREAGIRPIMITGDNRLTASAIAHELGFLSTKESVVEAKEFSRLSDNELSRKVRSYDVYARVSPADKLRIVHAWQSNGEVVAMTGDGVNDAPALKAADIGIAVASGTDVARETADLVLLDNSFQTIISAVEEGRVIFQNIRKVILYLLSGSFTEILLVSVSVMSGLPLPFTASQILWINIIQDSFPAFALAFERAEPGIMRTSPRKLRSALLDRKTKTFIFIIAFVNNLFLLFLYIMLSQRGYSIEFLQSAMFASLGLNSLLFVFSCRSLHTPLWMNGIQKNRYLIASVFGGMVVILVTLYLPPIQYFLHTVSLSPQFLLLLFSIAGVQVLCIEGLKWGYNRLTE
jgi:Ca2+-transporting ATPase